MFLLLTEKTGYSAIINTEFMTSATTALKPHGGMPEHTVVSLADGTSITVLEDPGTIMAIMEDGELEEVEPPADEPPAVEVTLEFVEEPEAAPPPKAPLTLIRPLHPKPPAKPKG